MNDVPRQTLRGLVARYGHDLCSNERRCEGLLRDLCGAHRREINILVVALREHVPLDLLAARGSAPRELLLARLAKRLEEQSALTGGAARWAVESWALALGVATDAEIEQWGKPVVDVAPPASTSTTRPPPVDATGPDESAGAIKQTPATPPARTPRRQGPATRPPTAPLPKSAPQPLPPATGPLPPLARQQPSATRPSRPQPPADPSASPQHDPGGTPLKKRGRRWRGCAVGCFLLIILSLLLFFGVPFVVSVLREEQLRRNSESPPAMPQ